MEITDVRVKVLDNPGSPLRALCSITLDGDFVVRDFKILDGTSGLFVAMPSRKVTMPCPNCNYRNHARSKFCNDCGKRLPQASLPVGDDGKVKSHREVAHPTNSEFRARIQEVILQAYHTESGATEVPGADRFEEMEEVEVAPARAKVAASRGQADDYGAMIAGLDRGDSRERGQRRGGGGRGGAAVQERRPARRDERGRGAARPKPRKQEAEPAAQAPRKTPPKTGRPMLNPPTPTPTPTPAPQPQPTGRTVDQPAESGDSFGAGILAASQAAAPRPRRDRVQAPPEVPKAKVQDEVRIEQEVEHEVPSNDSSDDSSAFGAGLF